MTDLATAALVRRHAELVGEIEAMQARIDRRRADLIHLHAAIRIMDPEADPNLARPKRPKREGCAWFGQGELGRVILDALREAGEPLTNAALARRIMERRGLDPEDRAALRRMEGMVGPALRRRDGKTVAAVMQGRRIAGWRVAG